MEQQDLSPVLGADNTNAVMHSADVLTETTAMTEIPANNTANETPSGGLFGGGSGMMILIYAVILGGMYFLLLRPQRKKEKQMKEMQAAIRTGDNVVTSSGMFGKVMDVGEDCFVVEFGTNRGVRIPVRKSDVLGVKEPKMTPAPKTE